MSQKNLSCGDILNLRMLLLVCVFVCVLGLFLFLFSLYTNKYPETVKVKRVVDGDTFITENNRVIRLLGIDAPEKGQKCFEEARRYLQNLIEGREVKLEYDKIKHDKYGRLLAYVWVGSLFVNKEMIEKGYAVFKNYGKKLKYEKLLNITPRGCVAELDTCEKCIGIAYFKYNPSGDDCKNAEEEYVKLKNYCNITCNLTGWKIRDKDGNIFVLPRVILQSYSVLYIYSGCGKNEVLQHEVKIYLCPKKECKAIWDNDGDVFMLFDEKGRKILEYCYGNGC